MKTILGLTQPQHLFENEYLCKRAYKVGQKVPFTTCLSCSAGNIKQFIYLEFIMFSGRLLMMKHMHFLKTTGTYLSQIACAVNY